MHSLLSDLGFSGAGVDSLLEGRFYIYLPRHPPTHFFDLPPWCPPQSFVRDGHSIWGINHWTIPDKEAVWAPFSPEAFVSCYLSRLYWTITSIKEKCFLNLWWLHMHGKNTWEKMLEIKARHNRHCLWWLSEYEWMIFILLNDIYTTRR